MSHHELDAYQNSPGGKAYAAIYTLENVVDDLDKLQPEHLLEYQDRIAAATLRLGHLLQSTAARKVA